MTYELSEAAYDDYLALYAQGVARFGTTQAISYSDDLERAFELLASNPRLARIRYELNPPVRVHPHRSHVIVYVEADNGIYILRIRHARENWTDHPV